MTVQGRCGALTYSQCAAVCAVLPDGLKNRVNAASVTIPDTSLRNQASKFNDVAACCTIAAQIA